MIKLKTIVIVLLVYLISFLSLRFNINLLYPYYYFKDLFLIPVRALSKDNNLKINKPLEDSIISSLKDEITELKKLNNISIVLSEFNYINATVIERNRDYWFNTITINKGKIDGIEEDMAVIDSDGLIGRISSVSDHSSIIKLITTNDTKNKISVVIKDNKMIYGIMSGYDSNNHLLKVIITDTTTEINKGVKVETTGMGGVFPSGILIGNVSKVVKDSDEVTTIVYVEPASNLKGEKYVSVLQRKEIHHY